VSRLIGREQAFASIAQALDDALAGHGQLLLIAGDAGIGKTALAGELLRTAPARGARVVWASCRQGEGSPAYWPWVQVLRSLSGGLPADAEAGSPEAARFRLFDAIAGQVVDAGRERPTAVVLDDLHWCDDPSLLALDFIAEQIRTASVLLLGTYRESDAGPTLLELARGARVVQLGGLDEADTGRLMTSVAGSSPDPAVARDVWRRTGGNPFFAREVTRLLVTDGGSAVPEGVREILGQRLSRLPADCADLLGTAALVGGEFAVDVVARAGGRTPDDSIALLERAVAARVLVRPPAPPGHFRFAHDLFRATAVERLDAAERARRHLAIAETLRELDAGGRPVPAAELAEHFGRAGTGAALDALRYSRLAARESAGRLAYEDACGHYERAIAAADAAGTVPAGERLALVLDLGEAQHRSGRTAAARATLLDAASGARTVGDPAALARAALGLHDLGTRAGTVDEQAMTVLADAVDAGPGPLLPRLLAAQARSLHHKLSDPDRPVAIAERAVELARASADPGLLAACLLALQDARWQPGSAAERLPIIEEMAGCAERAGDRELYVQARQLRAAALLELGDPAGQAELVEYCRLADDLGYPRAHWNALTRRATLAIVAGRLDEAEGLIASAAELGRRIGEPDTDGVTGAQLFTLAGAFGRPGPDPPLDTTVYGRRDDPLIVAMGRLFGGDRDGAARAMTGYSMLVAPRSHDPEPLIIAASMFAEYGPDEERRQVYELLLPLAGTHVVVGGCASYGGAIDHHLARLAMALGWIDVAEDHLKAALAMYERLGAPAWAELAGQHVGSLASQATPVAVFRREGDVWTLSYAGLVARVPDSKGLHDLATLLSSPGREVHVRDLLGVDAPPTGADPVIDATARAAYRARLTELAEEIEDADADNDLERAARAREERDFLVDELAAATGLGGRPRLLADETDKARKTVTARIRYTISRLERSHPDLAAHLSASVRTGIRCSYVPEQPVRWQVQARSSG
jgi:tetratricopeptide (TPR) repeat protein